MLGAKPTPGLQRGRPRAPPLSINTDTPASLGAVKQIPPCCQLQEEQTDISKEQQSPVRPWLFLVGMFHLTSESHLSWLRCGWGLKGAGRFYISPLRLPEVLPSNFEGKQEPSWPPPLLHSCSRLRHLSWQLPLCLMARGRRDIQGTFTLSSLLAYSVSVSSHPVTSLS